MVSPALRRVFLGFAVAFVLFTRFYALDDKPYHHDEGIYATLSYRLAQHFDYRFDPVTHGPLLFFFQAALFKVLPVNDATGRLPAAIFGLAFIAFGLVLLRNRSERERWTFLALTALSPILTFFSRFLGMDIPMAALATGFLAFVSRWDEKRRPRDLYVAAAFAGAMICLKLNWLFYAFSFATFLFASGQLSSLRAIPRRSWAWLLAIPVGFYLAFYSSFGTNPGGIWDGTFGKMLPYWINQNKIQRIAGPFHYYLMLVGIYELPLILGTGLVGWRLARARKDGWIWIAGGLSTAILWVVGSYYWRGSAFLRHHLHMDAYFHPALAAAITTFWIAHVRHHMRQGERLEAFFAHWMWISVLLYGYAGEKIPWLAVHVVAPAVFYFSILLASLPLRAFCLAAIPVAGFQALNVARSSFTDAADPRERLVYTHTTVDLGDFLDRIDAAQQHGRELKIQVAATCQGVWPLSWYLRNQRNWFRGTLNPREVPHIVFSDWDKKDALLAEFGPRYAPRRLPLRAWWVPDPYRFSARNFIRYYFTHENFSPSGSTDLVVLIRTDLLNEIEVSR